MDQKTALNEAIRIAGGISLFTPLVGAPSANAVKAWRISGVPERYCPTIERVTGIRCEMLRPDVEWAVLRLTAPTNRKPKTAKPTA